MAVIPEIQRTQLASSVVGVPQADTSTADILATVAKTARDIAQVAGRSGGGSGARAVVQSSLNTVQARRLAIPFTNDISKLRQQNLSPEEFNRSQDATFQNHFNAITDANVQGVFGKEMSKFMVDSSQEVQDQELSRQVQMTEIALNGGMDDLGADMAAVAGSELDFEAKLFNFNKVMRQRRGLIEAAAGLLEPEALQKLHDDSGVMLAETTINGLMDSDPKNVDTFLDDVVEGSGLFNNEEIKRVKATAKKFVEEQDRGIAQAKVERTIISKSEDLESFFGGQGPTEQDLILKVNEGVYTQAEANTFRQLKQQRTLNQPLQDNPARMDEIDEAFSRLSVVTKAGPQKGRVTSAAAVEAVAAVHQMIMESLAAKQITESQASTKLKALRPRLNEGIEQVFMEMIERDRTVIDWWPDSDFLDTNNPGLLKTLRGEFRQILDQEFDFMEASNVSPIDGSKRKPGTRANVFEQAAVLERAKARFNFQQAPQFSTMKPGTLVPNPATGRFQKFKGVDRGVPVFFDDINAVVADKESAVSGHR